MKTITVVLLMTSVASAQLPDCYIDSPLGQVPVDYADNCAQGLPPWTTAPPQPHYDPCPQGFERDTEAMLLCVGDYTVNVNLAWDNACGLIDSAGDQHSEDQERCEARYGISGATPDPALYQSCMESADAAYCVSTYIINQTEWEDELKELKETLRECADNACVPTGEYFTLSGLIGTLMRMTLSPGDRWIFYNPCNPYVAPRRRTLAKTWTWSAR